MAGKLASVLKQDKLVRQGSPSCFEDLPLRVHWKINDSCNFRCSYCFDAKRGYPDNYCSIEEAETAIKHLAAANRPSYYISLLGGEPTMHPHLAEIITLLGLHLGERAKKISMLTNGSFNSAVMDSFNSLAKKTTIDIKVSVHMESFRKEQLHRILDGLSDDVALTFFVMIHPALFEQTQEIVETLCELRRNRAFGMQLKILREPPKFIRDDSRYTSEHYAWAKLAQEKFKRIAEASGLKRVPILADPGYTFFIDKEKKPTTERISNLTEGDLKELTRCNFSGMTCCAGTHVICIGTKGSVKGTVCKLDSVTCNIFKENPFLRDDWMHPIKCSLSRCGCSENWRIPKFRSKKEALSFIESLRKENCDQAQN